MRLARRGVVVLDPHVQLLLADAEPNAAPHAEGRRLLDLVQPEHTAEEASGLVLAAGRRRKLHVIDRVEHRTRIRLGLHPQGNGGCERRFVACPHRERNARTTRRHHRSPA